MAPSPTVVPSPDRTNAALCLGFLTVLNDNNGYLGGYLVTNSWGRPLEFRLSSAVQPNKVQQILYGGTLVPYICADLIGKTLIDKTGVPVALVVTDCEAVLDLRLKIDVPVVWLPGIDAVPNNGSRVVAPATESRGPLLCHPRFVVSDVAAIGEVLAKIDTTFDLAEPFRRVREAIAEARKLGASGRAAA